MKEDIRTKRTKLKIKTAFVNLLKNNIKYDSITVSDIAKEAKINRVTFYTHYIDKACLVQDIIDDSRKKYMMTALEKANTVNSGNDIINYSIGLTTSLLDISLKCKDFLIILQDKENGAISRLLEEQINTYILLILNKINDVVPFKYPPRHVASFVVPGFINLIFNYVVNDADIISKEQFIKNLEEITINLVNSKIFTK